MSLGLRLDAVLRWLADRAVIGLLVLLAAIPVLTAPAALAAGIAASRADGLGKAIPAFGHTYWRSLVGGLLPAARRHARLGQ